MRKKHLLFYLLCVICILSMMGCNNNSTDIGSTETTEDVVQEVVDGIEIIESTEATEIETSTETTEYVEEVVNNTEKEETVKNTENQTQEEITPTTSTLDAYGGYCEYTHAKGGNYCIGGYRFYVADFNELTDTKRQHYANWANAGVWNVVFLGTDEYGGREYGVMYYKTSSDPFYSHPEQVQAQQILDSYATSMGLIQFNNLPNYNQAGGVGTMFCYEDGLWFLTKRSLFTQAEIDALNMQYNPMTQYDDLMPGNAGMPEFSDEITGEMEIID